MRNYARVAASDDYQGPAGVTLLQSKAFKLSQGKKFKAIKNVFVIHDNQTFGKGVAQGFQARAKASGLKVLGFVPWDAKATSYEAIGEQIKSSGAQSVYLGGIVCNNGVKLLKDLRAVLGPDVVFVGPDGWTPYSATLAAGSAAQGMYVSYAGQPLEKLPPTGKKFIAQFRVYAKIKGSMPPYAVYQAQAAQIMLGRDRAVERHARLGGQGAVQDERQERDHGHVPLRQERRHRSDQVDQLRPVRGKAYVSVFAIVSRWEVASAANAREKRAGEGLSGVLPRLN